MIQKVATAGQLDSKEGKLKTLLRRIEYAINSLIDRKDVFVIPISDETTAITTGTKLTMRWPYDYDISDLPRASLATTSSGGNPTFDINVGGSSILSTKLTVDAGETTSTTAATPAVLSSVFIPNDAEVTIDIDAAGTGAKGAKITLYGRQVT